MLRKAVVLVALAAFALPQAATARTASQLMPGVRYIREARVIGGDRVVFHVVYAPKPGGLYGRRPVLSGNTVSRRETLSSMQRRMLPRANVVGVNGDFFTFATGHPNGTYVQGGALYSHPFRGR